MAAAEYQEYSEIMADSKKGMMIGRLKLTNKKIIFKNTKSGKFEHILADDIKLANYQRFGGFFGLRICMKNCDFHRYTGFNSADIDEIANFFKKTYHKDCLEKESSLKGWNWGTIHFNGYVIKLDCGDKTSFELPLQHIAQCTTDKNEVAIDFHPHHDAISLMGMRLHIPETSNQIEPIDELQRTLKRSMTLVSDFIAVFREVQCITPRGRYEIKIFEKFLQLHGKTFDFKIPLSTVLQMFLLPHNDNRQMFFVLLLNPPIEQGQTRYHYLVFLFSKEEETSIEFPYGKYKDRITGPVYKVFSNVMGVLTNRKAAQPGSFDGHTGTPAVDCSFKTTPGYLYPLGKGFMYVPKPPIYIRYEDISSVNFARLTSDSTRSFDLEIESKSMPYKNTFSGINKEEYSKLFDFINAKKILKNAGKNNKSRFKHNLRDLNNQTKKKDEVAGSFVSSNILMPLDNLLIDIRTSEEKNLVRDDKHADKPKPRPKPIPNLIIPTNYDDDKIEEMDENDVSPVFSPYSSPCSSRSSSPSSSPCFPINNIRPSLSLPSWSPCAAPINNVPFSLNLPSSSSSSQISKIPSLLDIKVHWPTN